VTSGVLLPGNEPTNHVGRYLKWASCLWVVGDVLENTFRETPERE